VRNTTIVARSLSVIAAIAFCYTGALAQPQPVADGTWTPAQGSYDPAARSRPLNARGYSNPLAPSLAAASMNAPLSPLTLVGSQSYNRIFPILNLPGRNGMSLVLNLYYNSRIWTVDTAQGKATFNADRDLSYGFRIGPSTLEYDAIFDEYTLTEVDGSKRLLANSGSGTLYDTSDGSFSSYDAQTRVLTAKNGHTTRFEPVTSQASQPTPMLLRPVAMTDTNGNSITYAYVAQHDLLIQSMRDTVGRVVNFNYDGSSHLTSITQTLSSSATRTYIALTWGSVPFNYAFSLATTNAPSPGSINVITAMTYSNGVGYRFTYGDWGIVQRIDTLSASGAIRGYASFDFPGASTSAPLDDSPGFAHEIDSPDNVHTYTWTYDVTKLSPGVVTQTIITDPNGNRKIAHINASGLLTSIEQADSTGRTLATVSTSWTTVSSAPVRDTVTTVLNDTGQQSSIHYAYDAYANVTDVYEHDFGGQLVRHTALSYAGGPYVDHHILDRVTQGVIKDGSDVIVARTDYAYDTTSLTAVTGAINHDDQNYGPTLTTRGNLTAVTRYANAAAGSGAITRNISYDTLGNQQTVQVDCCNLQRISYGSSSQFAYPETVIRGPDSGPQFTVRTAYDPDTGLLTSQTDENGQKTTYQYDSMGRLILTTPPSPAANTSVSFDDGSAAPTVTSSTNANGVVTVSTFDGLSRLVAVDTNNGATLVRRIAYTYDGVGQRTAVSNPFGPGEAAVYTQLTYDALGRSSATSAPSSGQTTYAYLGNAATVTDPAGKQRRYYLDALQRLVRVDEPGWGDALTGTGTVTIEGGEGAEQVCQDNGFTIPPSPPICATVYDAGTVSVTVNGLTKSTTYGRLSTNASLASDLANAFAQDPSSSVWASSSGDTITFTAKASGAGTNYSVSGSSSSDIPDRFGSGSFTPVPPAPTLTGGEDMVPAGLPVLSASRHLTTTYVYDGLNNLLTSSQGAVGPVAGQQLAGQLRSYAYDSLGRLLTSTTPEAGTVTDSYLDTGGNPCANDPMQICRTTDARGVATTFAYDGVSRLIREDYSDGTPSRTYTYDTGGAAAFALGRLTQLAEGGLAQNQKFLYDNLGRITAVRDTIGQATYFVRYAYNGVDQITSTTYPTGRIVTRSYDAIGRLASLASGGTTYLAVTAYNSAQQPTTIALGNGVQGTFAYDDHLRRASLRYVKAGNPDLLDLTYDYGTGNNGQIQAIHYFSSPGVEDTTRTTYFTYDAWARLATARTGVVSATPGTWSLQWTYDRFGNRLQQLLLGGNYGGAQPQFTVSEATNRIGGFVYDAAGNLTSDGVRSFSYDALNRLLQINGGATSYGYFGPLRTKKTDASGTTTYIYSGNKPIVEYVNGAVSKEYIYNGNSLLVTLSGNAITYHHPDHLSDRAESDATGAVIRQVGHTPWGEITYEQGVTDKWKFTTYERDPESGLDYAQFRYSSSVQGRFLSRDPLLGVLNTPQSLNRYSYAANDPVNNVDPTGLECVWDDGSFDGSDDPGTGNVGACQLQGGTWIELGLAGAWSPFENHDLAQAVQNINSGLWTAVTASGVNGVPYVTHYDKQGRVDWTAGGGVITTYGYFQNEVDPRGSKSWEDPGGAFASAYRNYLLTHPGLPVDPDDRYIYLLSVQIDWDVSHPWGPDDALTILKWTSGGVRGVQWLLP
jgi:RHS repeat-associated protein